MAAKIINPSYIYIQNKECISNITDTGQSSTGIALKDDIINFPAEKVVYADLSGNGWNLLNDVLWISNTETPNCSWVSSTISNADCNITDESITISSESSYITNPRSITINFGKDYCTDFSILLNATSSSTSSTTSEEIVVTSNSSKSVKRAITKLEPGQEIKSIVITFSKTHMPEQFVYVDGIMLGEFEEFSDLKNLELTQEIDVLSTDLPINELSVTILSDTTLTLDKFNTLDAYDNFGTYRGRYYIDSVYTDDNMSYDVIAYSAVFLLDKSTSSDSGPLVERDFPTMLRGFGLSSEKRVCPDDIKFFYKIRNQTNRDVLQKVCQSTGTYVDCANSDKLCIKDAAQYIGTISTKGKIASSRVLGRVRVINSELYSKVISSYNKYYYDPTAEIIADIPILPGETVYIDVNYPLGTVGLDSWSSNASRTDFEVSSYGDYQIRIIDKRDSGSDATCSVRVTYYKVGSVTTDEAINDNLPDDSTGAETLVIDDNDYRADSRRTDVMALRKSYIQHNKEIEADIILGSVNVGEMWNIETYVGTIYKVLITSLIIDGSGTPTAHMKGLVW
ncbi:MAG: hypothetical protein PUB08_07600 [Firmicutes bacterium]|nr:hypothetical protein [Bacillota bacterium]